MNVCIKRWVCWWTNNHLSTAAITRAMKNMLHYLKNAVSLEADVLEIHGFHRIVLLCGKLVL